MTDEGREIARIEVDSIESRDGALHVTGYFVPPRIVDDVIDYGPEVTVEGLFIDPTMIFTDEALDGMADRAAQAIDEAGGVERILAKYEGIAVNGMTAEETMRALREKCGLGEVIEGEIVDPPGYGTSYHYPHCNIGACTGCIPREVVDDCAGLGDRVHRLLAEGYESLLREFEAHAPYPPTHPRGYHSAYLIADEVQRVSGTSGVGFTSATYMTIDEAREWAAPTLYPEARAIEEPRLTWSDIQIKGLGNGT